MKTPPFGSIKAMAKEEKVVGVLHAGRKEERTKSLGWYFGVWKREEKRLAKFFCRRREKHRE